MAEEIIKRNGGNSRRKSAGASTPLNGGKSTDPHHLRASTGSCHDFCKFGGKHALEAEKRLLLSRRTAAKSIDNQNSVEIFVPAERKKTSAAKIKPSHAKSRAINAFDISKCDVSPKPDFTPKSNGGAHSMKTEIVAEKTKKNKMAVVKRNHSPNLSRSLPDAPKSVKQVVSSSEKVRVTVKPVVSSSLEKVVVSGKQTSPKSKEGRLYGKGVTVTSSKLKPSDGNDSLKPKSLKEKPVISPGHFNHQRTSNVKTEKNTRTPAKTISTSQRATLLPRPSLVRVANLNSRKLKTSKVVSSDLKNDKKAKHGQPKTELKQNDDVVLEKALYVIEPFESEVKTKSHAVESLTPPLSKPLISLDENENSCLSSIPLSGSSPTSSFFLDSPSSSKTEDQDESEYAITESETDSLSEYDETVNMEARKVHSDNNDFQPLKLLFRRGKVVDIQPEDNSPRRLKFRQRRIVGENQKIKGEGRRSLKKGAAVADGTTVKKRGSVKIALRHQDMQGKKDIQGLFNNVIEETASKLVGMRKSKVKALVGAFETVISLQEKKNLSLSP